VNFHVRRFNSIFKQPLSTYNLVYFQTTPFKQHTCSKFILINLKIIYPFAQTEFKSFSVHTFFNFELAGDWTQNSFYKL
jgi:hypothetical protein